jgi:hypothetical protein
MKYRRSIKRDPITRYKCAIYKGETMKKKSSDKMVKIMLGPRWQWLPYTSKSTQQLLKSIFARARISYAGRQNLKTGFPRPKSSTLISAVFHPLSLQWYFPHYAVTQSNTVNNNVLRREYLARTVTVSNWLSTPHGDVVRNENNPVIGRAQSSNNIRNRIEYIHSQLGSRQIQSVTPTSTGNIIHSKVCTMHERYNEADHREGFTRRHASQKKPIPLMLAVTPQPLREMSPAAFRGADHDLNAEPLQQAEHRFVWEDDFQTRKALQVQTKMGEMDSSSFVNELFDRALHLEPVPGIELQFLSLQSKQCRTDTEPTASVSETDSSTKRTGSRPYSAVNQLPTPISRDDLNRVADRVAQVLAKRQRFERERLGGV